MKSIISLVQLLILASSLALVGCSSGGGGSDDDDDASSVSQGLFVDAEVEGLSYTTSSGVTGVTDENGTYEYEDGDDITFAVGGVEIGTVPGAPKCTPTDFGAARLNIARFIQSLDADGDPTNGIDLADASAALAGTTISSGAFTVDTATFEANGDIAAALTATGDTLISAAEAEDNLTAGTRDTFTPEDLEDKLFVVVEPAENDIGIIAFDPLFNGAGEAFDIFASDTIGAGEDGLGFTETWSLDNGVLILTSDDDEVVRVTRVGGSSRAISVNVVDDGETESVPVTLLIPQPVTEADLGGDGTTITSKTYDLVTSDGTPIEVTLSFDGTNGTFETDEPGTGTFEVGADGENIITVVNDEFPEEKTLFILLGGDLSIVGESVDLLLLDVEIVDGTPDEYTEIGVGTITLKPSAL